MSCSVHQRKLFTQITCQGPWTLSNMNSSISLRRFHPSRSPPIHKPQATAQLEGRVHTPPAPRLGASRNLGACHCSFSPHGVALTDRRAGPVPGPLLLNWLRREGHADSRVKCNRGACGAPRVTAFGDQLFQFTGHAAFQNISQAQAPGIRIPPGTLLEDSLLPASPLQLHRFFPMRHMTPPFWGDRPLRPPDMVCLGGKLPAVIPGHVSHDRKEHTTRLQPGGAGHTRSVSGWFLWGGRDARSQGSWVSAVHLCPPPRPDSAAPASREGEGDGAPPQPSRLESPGTGEPGGLPSVGPRSVGRGWGDLAAAAALPEIARPASADTAPSIIFIKSTGHRRKYDMVSIFAKLPLTVLWGLFWIIYELSRGGSYAFRMDHNGPQKGPWLKDTRFFLFFGQALRLPGS